MTSNLPDAIRNWTPNMIDDEAYDAYNVRTAESLGLSDNDFHQFYDAVTGGYVEYKTPALYINAVYEDFKDEIHPVLFAIMMFYKGFAYAYASDIHKKELESDKVMYQ